MEIGLLWYDDSEATIEAKVGAAAKRFAERCGEFPTTCYANPKTLGPKPKKVGAIAVKSNPCVLPNHFWIGVEK